MFVDRFWRLITLLAIAGKCLDSAWRRLQFKSWKINLFFSSELNCRVAQKIKFYLTACAIFIS